MAWNFNAPMGKPVTSYDETADAQAAGRAGGVVGKLVGDVLDTKMAQDNQAKAQDLISKYNSKFPPFGNPKRSDDTNKLAQLLLPLDKEMASKYLAQASAEKAKETQLDQNRKVMEAGTKVSGTTEVPMGPEDLKTIDDEISAIEAELKNRAYSAGAESMQGFGSFKGAISPETQTSTQKDFSRYTPSINPWLGSNASKQDPISNGGQV